jgi:hypothetical protein
MSKPIKAEVFALEGPDPAVDYTFANGDRQMHAIGMEGWPILLELARAGKLTFQSG